LVKHFIDEKVGGVSGEKKVVSDDGLTKQEGLYWKYESALKKLDACYYTVVGAAGELFSFRKKLWSDLEADTILDDFMTSMRIVQKGYRVLYEPKAIAIETASASVKDEAKRKVRISAGGFQSIMRLTPVLNILKYGKASFLYISHRVLRWAVCPFCLILALLANIILAQYSTNVIYIIFLVAQVSFYILALLNWLLSFKKLKIPMVQPLQYFVFMNICVIRGFFRYINGAQTVTWERAQRQSITNKTSNTVA
jgi:cellulose synthase/poly-beta-1,6-N-acetylglucosamine synthase-like glycosyltransferase